MSRSAAGCQRAQVKLTRPERDQGNSTDQEIWSWQRTLSNWANWGADDERGTLNLSTRAKRPASGPTRPKGVIISCARTIAYESAADNVMPARQYMLSSGEAEPEQILGRAATDAFLLAGASVFVAFRELQRIGPQQAQREAHSRWEGSPHGSR